MKRTRNQCISTEMTGRQLTIVANHSKETWRHEQIKQVEKKDKILIFLRLKTHYISRNS